MVIEHRLAGSAPPSDPKRLSREPPMFGFNDGARTDKATLEALGRSLAIIEFDPAGKILSANENFCKALGYQASEIIGQHHSLFVEPDYVRSAEYREFWAKLDRGEFDAREYNASARVGGTSGSRLPTIR
jgi:methyl-accepting chemotaxis protein